MAIRMFGIGRFAGQTHKDHHHHVVGYVGGGVDAVIQGGDKLGLDLDLSSDRVNIDLHNFSGRSEKNRVKGTMNGGGIPVYMRASGGSVNVDFVD